MSKFKIKAVLVIEQTLVKEIDAIDENTATIIALSDSKDEEWKSSRELKILTK